MKKLNLVAIIAIITLAFSSCSSNETLSIEEQSLDLLKSFTVKRDINGSYSLDYSLNDNAETENVVDKTTNTNNIYLFATDNKSHRSLSQELTKDNAQLKVGFIDASSDKIYPNITIEDDNIVFARSNSSNDEMLSEYSITGNEDGTFTLDFTVKNDVEVDFSFNDEIKIYEVHLVAGESNQISFSRVLEKEDGELLKLDFVNHINTNNTSAKSETTTERRKPRTIIYGGGD